jgi:hypothetical protein
LSCSPENVNTEVLPLRPPPLAAFEAICQIERKTAVKENAMAGYAVTQMEHPLPARVRETLESSLALPKRAFWPSWSGSCSTSRDVIN